MDPEPMPEGQQRRRSSVWSTTSAGSKRSKLFEVAERIFSSSKPPSPKTDAKEAEESEK